MKNKFNRLTLAAAVTAAAFTSQAQAGGFQLNEQSVSGQGYGHAGRSSNVQDATIVFGNPAGMSFLDRAQLSAGATYLVVNNDISNVTATRNVDSGVAMGGMPNGTQVPAGPIPGGNEGDMVGNKAIPFAFYAHPVNDRLAFGFGVYAPFGSKTDYEDDFQGRYFGNYTEVTVVSAQPTVSYRFNEQWSIGAGITYNQVEGELRRQIPSVQSYDPAGDVDARVDGDDEAWGYNIGVMYQPVPETTLGLTYRSEVEYELEGDFKATDPMGNVVRSDNAYLDLTTPETVNFSVTQQMTDRLKLMFGASWSRWSKFQEIRVTGDTIPEITNETQNYSNAWAFAVGGEYQLNPQWVLRAGLSLDETPSNDEHRSVRIPSDDRRIFSLGAGWTPTEALTIDFAYSYLTEHTTRIEQTRADHLASPATGGVPVGGATYAADYKNEAHGFGAQLTYRF
ncbi:outer membrane protein transport protein [Halomonas sp. KAO]|uniref:OmpP1/FadL family transporter n=1 Tax=unclassified Halomonas TaxID=2609666 RepID=UPI0018A0EDD3|nr:MULTISPECIES: TonB-dependent receptor [unclassified Halomonas]MBF7052771.1 outer membrane protein transport protein [Halomonas sp. KAO]MDT0512027.1 outer membrane protein transport protein [Halomonas sp. LES1]MDT0590836.1 outer membrane protein transport protein [Halomonas sp. PAR8]